MKFAGAPPNVVPTRFRGTEMVPAYTIFCLRATPLRLLRYYREGRQGTRF
jgi:hypothetical protein